MSQLGRFTFFVLFTVITKRESKRETQILIVPRTGTEGKSSNEESRSGDPGDNQVVLYFGGIFSHFLF